jgi:hypothetical protein
MRSGILLVRAQCAFLLRQLPQARGSREQEAMSIRRQLDELIDWYEREGAADAGRVIPVVATRATVKKFARKHGVRNGPWLYRGREIVPVRKPRKEREIPQQQECVQT